MIPVVLVHYGKSDHYPLDIVMATARRFGNEVVLIGDEANGAAERMVDYASGADRFAAHFENLSAYNHEFCLFCLRRWFILREWMEAYDVQDAFFIDSDVLVFCNVTDEYARWGNGYDLTLVLGTSPTTCYCSLEGLDRFCDWMYSVYADRNETFMEFQRISKEMRRQNLPGGIIDMTLFKFYRERIGDERVGEMTRIVNGATWDHAVTQCDGYIMRDGIKAIDFHNGIPYGQRESDGAQIQFLALHCQGRAKHLLEKWGRG